MKKDEIDELIRQCEANEIVAANRAWSLIQAVKELQAYAKRLEGRLSKFQVFGTDGCKNCETGRVTLYFTHGYCLECRQSSYEKNESR